MALSSLLSSFEEAPSSAVFFLRAVYLTVMGLGTIQLWRLVLVKGLRYLSSLATPSIRLNSLGKWAVVTGGTDGIGKALALDFAREGLSLLLIARDAAKLKATADEIKEKIRDYRGEVKTLCVDFSEKGESIYARLAAELKDLDIGILLNNVGMSYPSAMYYDELPPSLLESLLDVNVRSALRLTQIVYKGMCERKRGAVVCVGSGAAALPSDPLYAAYVASKAALSGFCQTLQVECASKNVIVQCHVPLLVTTKVSKVKTTSLLVPSTETYSKTAIRAIQRGTLQGPVVISPYWFHSWILCIAHFMPVGLWNTIRLRQVRSLRERAIRKQQRMESEGQATENMKKTM